MDLVFPSRDGFNRASVGSVADPAEPAVGPVRRHEAHEDEDHHRRAEVRVQRGRAGELLGRRLTEGETREREERDGETDTVAVTLDGQVG